MSVIIRDNHDDGGPAEVLYEEVNYDLVAARPPPPPDLYERPIFLSPRSARRVKAMPARPRTFEKFGEAPRAPVEYEYDDVGPVEPEQLEDDVAPTPSRSPRCEDTTSESAQYLRILP
ncbi:Hypothetical predicted protein [Cloeon dipterum]|nr:Hypothetical predicted protein [Cloeon dipterum]